MKTSIHIVPCKVNSSEQHNRREKKLDYVAEERQHLNESWACVDGLPQHLIALQQEVKAKTGRAMQAKATPIREGVVVIRPDTTMEDLRVFADCLEAAYGIKTLQIHIHRDEGHKENGEFKCNNHAHMVFDWINHDTGRSLKINAQHMSEIQTLLADTLGMERGIKSDKKHLSAVQYKTIKAEQESIKAEYDAKQSIAKASLARDNLEAMETPLTEVMEIAEESLIQPLKQTRWDALRLLFSPKRYMNKSGKFRAKLSIVEANFKKIVRDRQCAEIGLRKMLFEKSEISKKIKLKPEDIEALASKQTVVLKNIPKANSDEKMDIDVFWDEESKSFNVKENEAWKQNKLRQERLRQERERQERLRPKRGQEPLQGEQRRSRRIHR